jgi:hypothetical protein
LIGIAVSIKYTVLLTLSTRVMSGLLLWIVLSVIGGGDHHHHHTCDKIWLPLHYVANLHVLSICFGLSTFCEPIQCMREGQHTKGSQEWTGRCVRC